MLAFAGTQFIRLSCWIFNSITPIWFFVKRNCYCNVRYLPCIIFLHACKCYLDNLYVRNNTLKYWGIFSLWVRGGVGLFVPAPISWLFQSSNLIRLKVILYFFIRTAITKFMPSNEVGQVFSVLGVLSSLFPFVSKPFYAFFYKATLEEFPELLNF